MISLTVYLKDHRRMPVRFGSFPLFRDPQADIPRNWCICCGSEIFDRGEERCLLCRKERKE